METFEFVAAKEDKGERLDRFLQKNLPGVSRSHVKTIIEEGGATVNGKVEKAGASLKENDKVVFNLPSPKNLSLEPENIPLDIVYEDDDIAVINKPQGMVVHPACGSENGTLVNALLYNLSSLSTINGVVRPGIVQDRLQPCQPEIIAAVTDPVLICLAFSDLCHINLRARTIITVHIGIEPCHLFFDIF